MQINSNLKTAFRFNASFSTLCAIWLLSASNWWALQFGLSDGLLIQIGGVGLMVFAGYLVWLSSTKKQPKASINSVIYSDWAYVIAALIAAIVAWGAISDVGASFLITTSIIVAIAAEWQRRAAFNS
jgi:hypothetical protein